MIDRSGAPIRVLIVDDSVLVRKILQDILSEDPEIEVVGLAKNGVEALKIAKWVNPDVITLDIEMPVLNGLECLKLLLEQGSYAIVVISSDDTKETRSAVEALSSGAVELIKKPDSVFSISSEAKKQEIINTIKMKARLLLVT